MVACRGWSRPWGLRTNDEDMRVSELFLEDRREWNLEKVAELFTEEEARRIYSIPLGLYARDNRLAWWFTRNGVYSANSGYFDVQRSISLEG